MYHQCTEIFRVLLLINHGEIILYRLWNYHHLFINIAGDVIHNLALYLSNKNLVYDVGIQLEIEGHIIDAYFTDNDQIK